MSFPQLFPSGTLFESRRPGGLTFLTNQKDETNQTVYTFSDVDIGQAQDDRRIIVAIHSIQTSESSISSVTIGGVSATIHVNVNSVSTTNDTDVAIASAVVPDGTTADIVITHSASRDMCFVGVWSLYGETGSSPHATASDTSLTGLTLEASIDIPEGGALIAATMAANLDGRVTWSATISENYDTNETPDGGDWAVVASGASRDGLGVQTGRTVQAVHNGPLGPSANSAVLATISWQYA
jgi:hypothetical protein